MERTPNTVDCDRPAGRSDALFSDRTQVNSLTAQPKTWPSFHIPGDEMPQTATTHHLK